jgi:hypothetical protein
MKLSYAIALVVFAAVIIMSCTSQSNTGHGSMSDEEWMNACVPRCAMIPFSETSPEITTDELKEGWYYGGLNQKKKGTPDSWSHGNEDTRSAMWYQTIPNTSSSCDCIGSLNNR